MVARVSVRMMSATLVLALTASVAVGYIHFPPMTLPKMCKMSHHIRVLKIEKCDKEKRVIVFGVVESLKGKKSQISSFRHIIRADAEGTKPIFDWVENGKTAVMFTIEGRDHDAIVGIGYVFIDKYCYSVDYNNNGKYWLLIRCEPGMSTCYYGSVERLRTAIQDTLAGKKVKIPVKEPAIKMDRDRRNKEINDVREKNRRSEQ